MKLIDSYVQPPIAGLPASLRELWDIGNGYEIFIMFGTKSCTLGIRKKNIKNITYEVAKLLGLDMSDEVMIKRSNINDELYVSQSIDCVSLNYNKPENYKELLLKLEKLVSENFK